MRFAIIGCGEAGSHRAAAIAGVEGASVTVCADAVRDRAEALAARLGASASQDWRTAISRPDVDAVIVATSNNLHAPVATAAAEAGKHLLVERPLARNVTEGEQIVAAAREHRVKLKTGLASRYTPVSKKARHIMDGGRIGKPIFLRARTGRGSYLNPVADWMVDCDLSGGGTLVDNGYDLIDLCRYFLGDFRSAIGHTADLVYEISPCEDNAFVILQTGDGRSAILHSSWTDWRDYMSIDISGTDGYILLDYDASVVKLGSRPGSGGVVLEEEFDLSAQPDTSLATEVTQLIEAVENDTEPAGSGEDGLEALMIARAVYRSSEDGMEVRI